MVALGIAAEIEGGSGHSVILGELLCEPPTRSDGVESHSVSVLGQDAMAADRVEPWLEVLHEIAGQPTVSGVEDRIGRGPEGGEGNMCVGQAVVKVDNLRHDFGGECPHHMLVVPGVTTVGVDDMNPATVAGGLEMANQAEHGGGSSGARPWRQHDPVQRHRLARGKGQKLARWRCAQVGGDHVGFSEGLHVDRRSQTVHAGPQQTLAHVSRSLLLPQPNDMPVPPGDLRGCPVNRPVAGRFRIKLHAHTLRTPLSRGRIVSTS